MLDKGTKSVIIGTIECHGESEYHLKGDYTQDFPHEALPCSSSEIQIKHKIRRGILMCSCIFIMLDRISQILSSKDFLGIVIRNGIHFNFASIYTFSIHFE